MYNPQVGQELSIDGVTWQVVQHPGASGMAYGQEGRAAVVYQLCSSQHRYTRPALLLAPGGLVFEVPADGSALRMGRGPDNDAVLSEAAVSREHGALVIKDSKLYAWDNSSRNGTFLDGKKIDPQQWVEIPPGSRLQLGTVEEGATLAVRPESSQCRGLKAFKARFRLPTLSGLSSRLAAFADLPGLSVCRRVVLTPEIHPNVLTAEPDLTYAVVMPWVEGRSWMEVIMDRQILTPAQALQCAHQLVDIFSHMEQKGLAHCDISGPNVSIEQSSAGDLHIHLVDVEQLYGPGLDKPDDIFAGSPGYAHKGLGEYAWSAESDRFSGAIMLCEMLAWCDAPMTKVAWSESFFDPNEMQTLSSRSQEMRAFLADRWGTPLARLFDRVWSSDTPAQCPTFSEWQQALPPAVGAPARPAAVVQAINLVETAPVSRVEAAAAVAAVHAAAAPAPAPVPAAPVVVVSTVANAHMDEARRLEESGDLAGAVRAYRQALAAAGTDSATGREVTLILADLERQLTPTPVPVVPPPVVATPPPVAAAPVPVAASSASGKVKADPHLVARIRELEGAPGIAPVVPPKPPKKASLAPVYALIAVGVALLIGFLLKYGSAMRASGDVKVGFVEPASGTTVKGPLLLKASVDNDTGKPMDSVVFYLDGKPVGLGVLAGPGSNVYQLNWEGQAGPGAHELKVVARATTGLERSASVSVQAPSGATLTLVAPVQGQGIIQLGADVENAAGPVTEVVFEADGKPVGKDSQAPFGIAWNSSGLSDGPVHLRARATFQDGSTAESAPATVNLTKTLEVVFYATVTDGRGGHPLGLKAENFLVKEDGAVQSNLKVGRTTDEAVLSAVIVIDHSGSMFGSMEGAIAAARNFVDQLRPTDRVSIVSFSDRPTTAVDFTSDRSKLKGALAKLKPQGGTALYDSVDMASDMLASRPGRRAIILLTDGKDENASSNGPGSGHTLQQALDGLRRGEITLYALGLGKKFDRKVLNSLADKSGGRAYFLPTVSELLKAYSNIAEELRSQYTITWQSSHPMRDGKWRQIEIRLVNKPGFKVSAQAGYQAPSH